MERKRGSTELTLMRSLSWQLGRAGKVNHFLGIRTGERWLPPPKETFEQGFNQDTSAVLASIVWMVLGMCWLATSTRAAVALHAEKKFVHDLSALLKASAYSPLRNRLLKEPAGRLDFARLYLLAYLLGSEGGEATLVRNAEDRY